MRKTNDLEKRAYYQRLVLEYMKQRSTNNICDTQLKMIIYELHLYRNAVFHAIEALLADNKIKKLGRSKYEIIEQDKDSWASRVNIEIICGLPTQDS